MKYFVKWCKNGLLLVPGNIGKIGSMSRERHSTLGYIKCNLIWGEMQLESLARPLNIGTKKAHAFFERLRFPVTEALGFF